MNKLLITLAAIIGGGIVVLIAQAQEGVENPWHTQGQGITLQDALGGHPEDIEARKQASERSVQEFLLQEQRHRETEQRLSGQ